MQVSFCQSWQSDTLQTDCREIRSWVIITFRNVEKSKAHWKVEAVTTVCETPNVENFSNCNWQQFCSHLHNTFVGAHLGTVRVTWPFISKTSKIPYAWALSHTPRLPIHSHPLTSSFIPYFQDNHCQRNNNNTNTQQVLSVFFPALQEEISWKLQNLCPNCSSMETGTRHKGTY